MLTWGQFLRDKPDHVVRSALQDITELFKSIHGDAFVVSQIIDSSRIDSMLLNESIGCNVLFFHGIPQRFIADHAVFRSPPVNLSQL